MECLKQFYGGSKNSRTSVYAKIFLTPGNHFIRLPKTSYNGQPGRCHRGIKFCNFINIIRFDNSFINWRQ